MINSAEGKKPQAPTINVGAQQVAVIYAKALLAAAEQAGQAETLVEEFDAVIHSVLDPFSKLETLLGSALVSPEEKTELLERLFADRLSRMFLNFLKVVARHGRLDVLRAIHQEFLKLYDVLRGRVRVQIGTAVAVDERFSGNLAQSLRGLLGGEPKLESRVDPALIGGVVLRVGDTVYDGSVARQLEQVREQMILRSIHEIQSRRDSFRHSGGN